MTINEIHYFSRVRTDPEEFVELYNTGRTAVDVSGWSFISGIRYQFPTGASLAPGGYLVVAQDPAFLKKKYGAAALGPFTGKLSRHGEKIELLDDQGRVVNAVTYQPGVPWPAVVNLPGHSIELVSPTADNRFGGGWRASLDGPTPGKRNSVFATNLPPQVVRIEHNPKAPKSGEPVKISARVKEAAETAAVKVLYQVVEPGKYLERTDAAFKTNWTLLEMRRGSEPNSNEVDYAVELPASVQRHRCLVRYRIVLTDTAGASVTLPAADDPQPNFAYFVYDGVPPWKGAIQPGSSDPVRGRTVEFGTNVMRRLPVYHLISKKNSVEASTWREQYQGEDYKWTGTLVYEGQVYDHIHYRARGGVWRYAMGKNMWKFSFNPGYDFRARDNFGKPYQTRWSKLNLRPCIQQGDYGQRGEQGMFEAVGFKLFNLAGVEAPHTHWIQFRIIDDAVEANPRSQYDGDFWGLYLVIEEEGGRFLDEHGLPDGSLYKMDGGTGELGRHKAALDPSKSDLHSFLAAYQRSPPNDPWWRTNLDLSRYYSYRSIIEGIHHYDVADGKNYDYYHNPVTGLWSVHPWDIDLTWADNMYGGGSEPFSFRVLTRPTFRLEYQNRLREIRDLLFNRDQAYKLIDEYAAIIADPNGGPSFVEADRAMWDFHPALARSFKGQPGLFYQAAANKNFAGMVQLMKLYVTTRGRWIDQALLADAQVPATPSVTSTSPTNFPVNHLTFRASPFAGSNFASMKWRLAEISDPKAPAFKLHSARKYEITPAWESEELTTFNADVTIPAAAGKPGHAYRVRVRMKNNLGRWSHWSPPVQFIAGEAVK